MDTITLEQHFYGSAPLGLGLGRGFQTIAKSPGIREHSLFEPHCSYTRPESRRTGATAAGSPPHPEGEASASEGRRPDGLPVNWGWFRLAEGDPNSLVCIHRIGNAGTDEFGRKGNYLAHNLIATDEQLRAIDYDIPALIRWVQRLSPRRFAVREGGDDGFAHRNAEIFELLGKDKAKLAAAPTLDVPVAAIVELRRQLDDNLATETVPKLHSIVGRDGIHALLSAYLVSAAERKPIWVFGCSDGTDECEAGLLLMEFVYGLLPYHCRRQLTFATYYEPPRSPAAAGRRRESPRANQMRQLVMTLVHQGRPTPAGQGFLIDALTQKHEVPIPPSRLAQAYEQWLHSKDLARLWNIRDVASQFAFPESDVLSGLEDARRFCVLAGKETRCKPAEYDLYHRLTPQLRMERRSFRELLDVGQRLIKEATKPLCRDAALWTQLTADYVHSLIRQFPVVAEFTGPPAGNWPDVQAALQMLFFATVHGGFWEALETLLSGVSTARELEPLRNEALQLMCAQVKKRMGREMLELLPSLWTAVERSCSRQSSQGVWFRTQVADHLWSVTQKTQLDASGAAKIDDRFVPILSAARMDRPEQLNERLNAVDQICRRASSGQPLQQFWEGAIQGGSIGPEVLRDIAHDRKDLLLSSYEVWVKAMQLLDEQRQLIEGPLRAPALVPIYWQHAAKEVNSPGSSWHRGLVAAIQALLKARDLETTAAIDRDVVEPYCSDGCRELCQRLQSVLVTSPQQLAEIAAAHCHLIELVQDRLARRSDPQATEGQARARMHLQDLLTLLCVNFDSRRQADGNRAALFAEPLRHVLIAFTTVAALTDFFATLAAAVWSRLRHAEDTADLGPLAAALRFALNSDGVNAEEVEWYGQLWIRLIHNGIQQRTSPSCDLLPDVMAWFLVERPDLALDSNADGSQRLRDYFRRRLDDTVRGKFKAQLLFKLFPPREARSSPPADVTQLAGAIRNYFSPEKPHRRMLEFGSQNVDPDTLEVRPTLWETATTEIVEQLTKLSAESPVAVCLALESLLACGILRPVQHKARDALHDVVGAKCREMAEIWRRTPPGSIVPEQHLKWVKDMLTALGWVAEDLHEDDSNGIWKLLGHSLFDLYREGNLGVFFPGIFRFGETIQNRSSDRVVRATTWYMLFKPIAEPDLDRTFLPMFVAAGSSLSADSAASHDLFQRLQYLKQLRSDSRSASWFRKEVRGTIRNFYRTEIKDLLEAALGDPPGGFGRAADEDILPAVIAQAQFAAVLYIPGPALARIYCSLGDTPGKPRYTAAALAGYLVLEGPLGGRPRARAEKICDCRAFWKELRRRRRKDAELIREKLESDLIERRVTPREAGEIAEILRKKLGRLLG